MARKRDRDTLSLETMVAPGDVLVEAMNSPRRAASRRKSDAHDELGGDRGPSALTLSVYFLDGTVNRVSVPPRATVRDVLLTLRAQIGLHADADFSLFLRESSLSGDTFHCLPDSMRAEEADAQALSDTRRLVYKRRLFLAKPLGAASVLEDGTSAQHVPFGCCEMGRASGSTCALLAQLHPPVLPPVTKQARTWTRKSPRQHWRRRLRFVWRTLTPSTTYVGVLVRFESFAGTVMRTGTLSCLISCFCERRSRMARTS